MTLADINITSHDVHVFVACFLAVLLVYFLFWLLGRRGW